MKVTFSLSVIGFGQEMQLGEEFTTTLTREEEPDILRLRLLTEDPNEAEVPREITDRLRPQLEERAIELLIQEEDPFTLECTGNMPMDAEELDRLIINRDIDALDFFDLLDAPTDEIDAWSAWALDELPTRREFIREFEPTNPFRRGYWLRLHFVDLEVPDEDEICKALHRALKHGDEMLTERIINIQECNCSSDIWEIAMQEAVRTANAEWITAHGDDDSLNIGDGEYCPYFDDTEDEEIRALLLRLGAIPNPEPYAGWSFACLRTPSHVRLWELSEKLREVLAGKLTEKYRSEALDDESYADFCSDEMELLGLTVEAGELRVDRSIDETELADGAERLPELLESLGCSPEFEGYRIGSDRYGIFSVF